MLLFYLAVIVFVSNSQENFKVRVCSDEAPKNAPFDCHHYAKLGLCRGVAEQFCRKSCERCNCNEAEALFCDKQGLMAFKNSFWTGQKYLNSWKGDNPCEWDFIFCNPWYNRVIQIDIVLYHTVIQDTMSASLVPDLSKLRYLEMIHIWSVYLKGELPPEYSVLNKLKLFGLQDSFYINGTLPAQYSEWTKIHTFASSNNKIIGTIPVEFSLWKSIKQFSSADNFFSGKLPPNFSIWKQIEHFTIANNKFTGTLSAEFSEWYQVSFLSVSNNKFTGSLPQEYSTLKQMTLFSLWENKFTKNLPVEFSKWVICEKFLVSSNLLTGTLPVQYSKMKRMKIFAINNNYFRGWLYKEFSTMVRLQQFLVYGNPQFENYVPKEWNTLQEHAKILLP